MIPSNLDQYPKTYYKKVFPKYRGVRAQICYMKEIIGFSGPIRYEEVLLEKQFKSDRSDYPNEKDYRAASIWATDQLKNISEYTTEKTK